MSKTKSSSLYSPRVEDIPTTIPVFPLRGAILLPRGTLPLNVFEPRYLSMVDDVLASGRVIGMVQPVSTGQEADENKQPELSLSGLVERSETGWLPVEEESPQDKTTPLRHIGCTGRLTAFTESDDRHMVITLTGLSRFEIKTEIDNDLPYRTCEVDYNNFALDVEQGLGEEEVDREQLLTVLRAYLNIHDLSADWESIHSASTEHLVNSLAMISPYGSEEKQALLEAQHLQERADILVALAEMEIAQKDRSDSGTTLQ